MENKKIIFFSAIFLVVGLIAGYFIGAYLLPPRANYRTFNGAGAPQGFQMNASVQNAVTSFFANATSQAQVDSYCSQDMQACFYYCRTLNPSDEYCASLMNSSGTYFRRG